MQGEWPTSESRPRRRDDCSAVELDDNVALYDDIGQLLILLNSSAATVWELCDGATTLGDMQIALSRAHPEESSEVAEDVRRTVVKLAELGLVVDADVEAETVGEAMDGGGV